MFIRAGITRGGVAQSRRDNLTMNDLQANSNNVGLSLVASMDTANSIEICVILASNAVLIVYIA